jgi:uncharacterized GH25 family protein
MTRRIPLLYRCLFACGALIAAQCPAHEFWLQAQQFRPAAGETVELDLLVGHGEQRQRSPLAARRITRFAAVGPDGKAVDQRGMLQAGSARLGGAKVLAAAGSHVLWLETDTRAQSHLPADRFNDHLHIEGLTPALAERERRGQSLAEGSERYGRCAKAIIRVGQGGSGSATRAMGLALEIVPMVDPYTQPDMLPVQVLYRGKPLAGATIKFTDLARDEEPREVRRSDAQGRAAFAMPKSGRWLLHVAWSRVLRRGSETDFETIFSSLSFGLD